VEEVEEGLVGRETTKDGTVETVHRLGKASQQEAAEELESDRVEEPWALLDECLIVGLRTADDLDLSDVGLSMSLAGTKSYPCALMDDRLTESTIFSTLLMGTFVSSIVTVTLPVDDRVGVWGGKSGEEERRSG